MTPLADARVQFRHATALERTPSPPAAGPRASSTGSTRSSPTRSTSSPTAPPVAPTRRTLPTARATTSQTTLTWSSSSLTPLTPSERGDLSVWGTADSLPPATPSGSSTLSFLSARFSSARSSPQLSSLDTLLPSSRARTATLAPSCCTMSSPSSTTCRISGGFSEPATSLTRQHQGPPVPRLHAQPYWNAPHVLL